MVVLCAGTSVVFAAGDVFSCIVSLVVFVVSGSVVVVSSSVVVVAAGITVLFPGGVIVSADVIIVRSDEIVLSAGIVISPPVVDPLVFVVFSGNVVVVSFTGVV